MKTWETSGRQLFEEEQHFPNWLLYLMWGTTAFSVGLILLVSIGKASANEMYYGLAVVVIVQGMNIYFLRNTTLQTVITSNGLYYRWRPFQKKYRYLPIDEIESVEIHKGPSLKYGYSIVRGYGRVHNMSDGKGLQVYLRNGKKVYFGTNEVAALEGAVAQLPQTLKTQPFER